MPSTNTQSVNNETYGSIGQATFLNSFYERVSKSIADRNVEGIKLEDSSFGQDLPRGRININDNYFKNEAHLDLVQEASKSSLKSDITAKELSTALNCSEALIDKLRKFHNQMVVGFFSDYLTSMLAETHNIFPTNSDDVRVHYHHENNKLYVKVEAVDLSFFTPSFTSVPTTICLKGTASVKFEINDDNTMTLVKDSLTFSNPYLEAVYTQPIESKEQFFKLAEQSNYASAKQALEQQIKTLKKSKYEVVQQQAQAAEGVLYAVENSQQAAKSGVSVAQATQVLEDTSALMQAKNINDFNQKSKNYQQSIKPMMTHKLGAAKKIGMAMLGFLGATALVAAVAVATVATAGVGLAVAGLSLVASAASLSAAASIYTRHQAKAEPYNSADTYKSFVTASENRYFKHPKSGEQVATNDEDNQPKNTVDRNPLLK